MRRYAEQVMKVLPSIRRMSDPINTKEDIIQHLILTSMSLYLNQCPCKQYRNLTKSQIQKDTISKNQISKEMDENVSICDHKLSAERNLTIDSVQLV
jgi:hypothetical protein